MSDSDRLGRVLRDGDRIGLLFERDLDHPPERVWRALTDNDQLRHWLPGTIEGPREAGARVRVPFSDDVADKYAIEVRELDGQILAWEPPRLFSWMWDTDTLIFELTPTASGTHLRFTTWVTQGPTLDQIAAGYHVCFDQLERLLDTDAPPAFVDQAPDITAYAALADISFDDPPPSQ